MELSLALKIAFYIHGIILVTEIELLSFTTFLSFYFHPCTTTTTQHNFIFHSILLQFKRKKRGVREEATVFSRDQ